MRAAMALLLVVVLAACSSDSDGDTPEDTAAAGGDDVVITVVDLSFPGEVTVPAGSTVRWQNDSGSGHTVLFDTMDGDPVDVAELDLPADGEAEADLSPGTWAYHCGIHPSMVGTLVVEG